MSNATTARTRPCSTCPYRKNVPSGIWHPDEYAKLPLYDAETYEQPAAVFACHHTDETVCAGWLGHTHPDRLLAVRLGVADGRLDPELLDYTTDVPLFTSGRAASDHGLRDVGDPSPAATSAMRKLAQTRKVA